MNKIDITEEQIQKLLEEVKQEFADMKKSEEEALAKAEEEKSKPEASKKEESAKAEGSEGSEQSMKKDFPPEEKKDDAPAEAAPAEDAPAESPEAPAEDPAAEGGEVSPDQLFDMYCKLSDEDLSMHYMACSKALFAKMDAPAESPEAPAPEAEAAAPAAPPEAPAEAPAEEPAAKSVSDEVLEAFKKTEQENALLKDESEKLKKKVDELNEVLTKLVSKPARSGFVSGNVNEAPPEAPKTLTKSQIMEALAKKAQEQNLSKEDQEKLVRYTLKPVFTEELSKFLEEKQSKQGA